MNSYSATILRVIRTNAIGSIFPIMSAEHNIPFPDIGNNNYENADITIASSECAKLKFFNFMAFTDQVTVNEMVKTWKYPVSNTKDEELFDVLSTPEWIARTVKLLNAIQKGNEVFIKINGEGNWLLISPMEIARNIQKSDKFKIIAKKKYRNFLSYSGEIRAANEKIASLKQ